MKKTCGMQRAVSFVVKHLSVVLLLLFFSIQVNSQNTFPPTGNVGIGTSSPAGPLQVVANGRDYYVNKTIDGYTEDAQGLNYLLLHTAFTSVPIEDRYVMGKITATRGGSNSWNRKFSVEVNTASAYVSNRGTLMSYYEPAELVLVDYNGQTYMAIALRSESALYNFSFTGYAYSAALQLVYDQDITNLRRFVSYDPVAVNGPLAINNPLAGNTNSLTFGLVDDGGNLQVPLGSSPGRYDIDFRTWRDMRPDQVGARIRAERINNYAENNALVQSMDLSFFTSFGLEPENLTERLRIRNNGNIGVGTSTPEQKLTVIMPADVNGQGIAVKAVNNEGNGSQPAYAWLDNTGQKRFYQYMDVASNTLGIGNSSHEPLFTVTQNGNVGIGVTDANGYKLAVAGSAVFKKVVVKNSNPWPDYVFDSSYHLSSLRQVEEYISINKHLPDVPSAAQVKKEGLDLGDNQAALLRKIEELTLYIIEQQKVSDNQKLQLEMQKAANIALENRLAAIEKTLVLSKK